MTSACSLMGQLSTAAWGRGGRGGEGRGRGGEGKGRGGAGGRKREAVSSTALTPESHSNTRVLYSTKKDTFIQKVKKFQLVKKLSTMLYTYQ